jgi:hypothetical protein
MAGAGAGGAPVVPQVPEIKWGRLFLSSAQSEITAVAIASDGSPVVAGNADSAVDLGVVAGGQRESIIAAYTVDNAYLWHHRLLSQGDNSAQSIASAAYGFAMAGVFEERLSTPVGDLVSGIAQAQTYVLGLSPTGVIQSAVHITGDHEVEDPCIAGRWVAVGINTTLRVNGTTYDAPSSFGVVQLNANHDAQLGAKVFVDPDPDRDPGASEVVGCGAASDGAFWLTGTTHTPLDFGAGLTTRQGNGDAFLAAFALDGQHRWSRVLGGPGHDMGRKVAVAEQAGLVYALSEYSETLTQGYSFTSVGLRDILIQGHDLATGNVLWSLPLGSAAIDGVFAAGVEPSGNLIFAGYHRAQLTRGVLPSHGNLNASGTFLASVSPTGEVLWAMALGNVEVNDLAVTSTGDIYVVGSAAEAIVTRAQLLVPEANNGFLLKLGWP